jgi:hypothetical protein
MMQFLTTIGFVSDFLQISANIQLNEKKKISQVKLDCRTKEMSSWRKNFEHLQRQLVQNPNPKRPNEDKPALCASLRMSSSKSNQSVHIKAKVVSNLSSL